MAQVDDRPRSRADAIARLAELNTHLVERTRQLETALESRVVIEQAKGILVGRHSVDLATAFDALRRGARSHRLRLHDLAARVVAEPETPAEIERYLG